MPTVELILNGRSIRAEVTERETLLDFLRGRMGLTGAKRGCDTSECGACTVIVNGKARRSCSMKAKDADGARVETIEGLAAGDRLHPLQFSFLKNGAVQCGFCTPGMILSAKALLDVNPDPGEEEIKEALKHNLCRCTGYEKILSAVRDAGKRMQEGIAPQEGDLPDGRVGQGAYDLEGKEKVTGGLLFADDYRPKGALVGKILWSSHPHARVTNIDTEAARKTPGVLGVYTWRDIPGPNGIGFRVQDQPVLAEGTVRSMGDAVAVVFAEDQESAVTALGKIVVSYEPLPVVSSIEEALAENAPPLHPGGNLIREFSYRRGEVEISLEACPVRVEGRFTTPFIEHAYLEPESVLAEPDGEDRIVIYTGTQYPHFVRNEVARILNLSSDRLRLVCTPLGGGFGGKTDTHPVIPLAALGALLLKRPVKMTLSRRESAASSTKRHAAVLDYRLGLDSEGRIQAVDAEILLDGGPYTGQSAFVTEQACIFACGPYRVPHLRVKGRSAHTNNANGGAFRGYGSNQGAFAMESLLDDAARKIGLDPLELRRRNVLVEGDVTPAGEKLKGIVQIRATVESALAAMKEIRLEQYQKEGWKIGIGVACGNKNVGGGRGNIDSAAAVLRLEKDGRLALSASAPDMGQGIRTGLYQILHNELGVERDRLDFALEDTSVVPECSGASAQRVMFCTGNAVATACRRFKDEILKFVEEKVGLADKDFQEAREGRLVYAKDRSVSLEEAAALLVREGRTLEVTELFVGPKTYSLDDRDRIPADEFRLYPAYSFSTVIAVVGVETKTGRVKVFEMKIFQDTGKAINPDIVEMQLHGCCIQALGYALSEQYTFREGHPQTLTLRKMGIPTISEAPHYECHLIELADPVGPYGAKGISETAMLPGCPAIINAIVDAIGRRIYSLPLGSQLAGELIE